MNKNTEKRILLKIIICIAIFMFGIMFSNTKVKAASLEDYRQKAINNAFYGDDIVNTLGSTISDYGAAYGTKKPYTVCIHEAKISRFIFYI